MKLEDIPGLEELIEDLGSASQALEDINKILMPLGYELVARKRTTRDIAPFDFGWLFKGTTVELWIDPDLEEVIRNITKTGATVAIKNNWFDPSLHIYVEEPETDQDAPITVSGMELAHVNQTKE